MTAGELATWLKDKDPSTIVLLSKDGEGNDFRILAGVDEGYWNEAEEDLYYPESDSEDEEDELDGYVPALVLWPVY